MKISTSLVAFSVNRPRAVTWLMLVATIFLALTAALPTLWPSTFSFLNPLKVDTDPENMLPPQEPVRVFHTGMKREMALYDMVVLGVVNESLKKIFELTQFAKTLRWKDEHEPGKHAGVPAHAGAPAYAGVIEVDLIAPSTVDNIEQGEVGTVKFEWLMEAPPSTKEECLAIRDKAMRIPFLKGTLVSENGKALCLYLPLTSKHLSYKVYSALNAKISTFSGDDRFYITGLPVAEDTFGVEMFKQMMITAPAAMLIIFLLMWYFFHKLVLIISPMIVAVVSTICTMGLLVATGNTVHIMSSMIPIFIIPIAVLDAIHILSEFFDRYQQTRDRKKTITGVMETLFTPMLYTSLTTMVGFASLALTPIPPVQVFGLFVGFGVMVAWFLTVTFVPAYVMFISETTLENFGAVYDTGEQEETGSESRASLISRLLALCGRLTFHHARTVLVIMLILSAVAMYGISRININDNPIKWFVPNHPIREADTVLNRHFGGTYMGYLTLTAAGSETSLADYVEAFGDRLDVQQAGLANEDPELGNSAKAVFASVVNEAERLVPITGSKKALLKQLTIFGEDRLDNSSDEEYDAWDEALLFIDRERQRDQVFKQPANLEFIAGLQRYLLETGTVGKSNSLSDIVKTVYRELISGDDKDFRIPDSAPAVAQCLITYQNSHRPQDLWHFVTPDYRKTVLWVQLKSGDNKDMIKVVESVDRYMAAYAEKAGKDEGLPAMSHQWFGLTYINVVWQKKMVSGMLQAFMGSFLCVFLMMTLLYKSAAWGFLCMIPLTVTIGLIYGIIGLVGKDYDMPIAVLSSLSLGLAVDYAIHFLSRSRELYQDFKSWEDTVEPMFGEPARAIARNVIVVGVGFLPLLLATLVPYQTVGLFIAAILVIAGVGTLLIQPALITVMEKILFPRTKVCCFLCGCATCIITIAAAVALAAINIHQFYEVSWTKLSWFSILAVIILGSLCYFSANREKCKTEIMIQAGEE